MAQGRSIKTIWMIQLIRNSRLSIQNSLSLSGLLWAQTPGVNGVGDRGADNRVEGHEPLEARTTEQITSIDLSRYEAYHMSRHNSCALGTRPATIEDGERTP